MRTGPWSLRRSLFQRLMHRAVTMLGDSAGGARASVVLVSRAFVSQIPSLEITLPSHHLSRACVPTLLQVCGHSLSPLRACAHTVLPVQSRDLDLIRAFANTVLQMLSQDSTVRPMAARS